MRRVRGDGEDMVVVWLGGEEGGRVDGWRGDSGDLGARLAGKSVR